MRQGFGALFLTGLLAACGGGGGGTPQPAPPPAGNQPPGFTSAATVSVAENSTGTIYQATATDPDGNPLTFGISGGADALRFTITTAGALAFAASPDFEAPTDADANNVYLVTLSVSDGTTSTTLSLAVTVTNAGPDGFRVRRIATGFTQPVYLTAFPDGSGRVLVVERAGRVRLLNPATGFVAVDSFIDLRPMVSTDGERGMLGLALAPNFQSNVISGLGGTFFVLLTDLGGNITIRRYRTLRENSTIWDPVGSDQIFDLAHPASNHNGGWMEFGPDGFLYVSLGDGGGSGDTANNAQNVNLLYGKILRINPFADGFPGDPLRDYSIPAGNPFAAGGGAPEIWAYGLRNPFRNSFDPATGNLWIGDVGEGAREEIDLMRPTDAGANFGWRIMEGTAIFNGTPNAGLVAPVAEYLHGSGPREGNSVTGGYVYRGPVEGLRGQYFFADFIRGNIWSFPISRITLGSTLASSQFTLRNADFTPDVGTINNISSFGVDQAGNLYIVDFDGEIFRVEPS
jgi:glucose/arabinose dehydrogenase